MLSTNDFKEILDLVIIKLKKKHEDLGQKATGDWENSLGSEVNGNSGMIMGYDYAKYLVEGRPPSSKLPPIQPLVRWATAKFRVSGKQAENIAWAVAKKIKQEGTTWHKKGGSDLLEYLESEEIISLFLKEVENKELINVQLAFERQLETLQS